MDKSPEAFRTISEVADWLDVPTHVLRFWESRFSQVKPVKRAGGRRYYRPNDMLLIGGIKALLHDEGMTIRGVQKLLREEGVKHVSGHSKPLSDGGSAPAPSPAPAPPPPNVEDAEVLADPAPLDPGAPLPRDDLKVEPVDAGDIGTDLAAEVSQIPEEEPKKKTEAEVPPLAENAAAAAPALETPEDEPTLPMFGSVRRRAAAAETEPDASKQPEKTGADAGPTIPATPNVADTDPADDDPSITVGAILTSRLRALHGGGRKIDRDRLRDARDRAAALREQLDQTASK